MIRAIARVWRFGGLAVVDRNRSGLRRIGCTKLNPFANTLGCLGHRLVSPFLGPPLDRPVPVTVGQVKLHGVGMFLGGSRV